MIFTPKNHWCINHFEPNCNLHKRSKHKPYKKQTFSLSKVSTDISNSVSHLDILIFLVAKCHICGKTFKTSSYLPNHINTMHKEEKVFKCKFCEKVFGHKSNLDDHVKTHAMSAEEEQQQRHTCDRCYKSFSSKSSMKEHVRTVHEKIKKFKCDNCGQSFSRMKVHFNHKCNKTENPV